MVKHLTKRELQAGLPHILPSPADDGRLQGIVIRPGARRLRQWAQRPGNGPARHLRPRRAGRARERRRPGLEGILEWTLKAIGD